MVERTLYERAGGSALFASLVEAFYDNVEHDPVLRPMYPADLGPPRRHLFLFLVQLAGGPKDYLLERGHPRLRLRHLEFKIDRTARDAWVVAMLDALGRQNVDADVAKELTEYFERVATFLINQGLSIGSSS